MLIKLTKIIERDGLWYTTKRIFAYTIAHLPLAEHFSFSYYKGTHLRFAPSLLTYQLFANRNTRYTDVMLFAKYLQPGNVCIDVGANTGSLTIPAAYHVGPSGTVLSIEPSPKFARIIADNVNLNNYNECVSIHQVALGADSNTVYLNESRADDTTNHIDSSGTAVRQVTLDSLTKELARIDLLKIDVEGYEYQVLQGATDTLHKTKVILIEFIPNQLARSGSKPEQVLELLNTQYDLFTFDADLSLSPFVYNNSNSINSDLVGINRNL
jgi:FkbM family methyltransferase